MAIATGTAIAIAAAASAGTSLYGAHKQADAAKKAAEIQQQGVREARAYGEPLYTEAQRVAAEQNRLGQAKFAPYVQTGQEGLTSLSRLAGLPGGAPPTQPASATWQQPAVPTPGSGGVITPQGPRQPVPDTPTRQAVPQTGAAASSASSYVTLRAPTGEVRAVPADQAPSFLARGATRVQ